MMKLFTKTQNNKIQLKCSSVHTMKCYRKQSSNEQIAPPTIKFKEKDQPENLHHTNEAVYYWNLKM